MIVHAEGATGASRIGSPRHSAAGAPGGTVDATFPITAGTSYKVAIGELDVHGGNGFGNGGGRGTTTGDGWDGGGGGGGTALFANGVFILVASGGGGGAGDGSSGSGPNFPDLGGTGGTGCDGSGQTGQGGGSGDGGIGGASDSPEGGSGGNPDYATNGGGGGGGGGGYGGGGGGGPGQNLDIFATGPGGGGGGAGDCIVASPATDITFGVSSITENNGFIIITFDRGDQSAAPVQTAFTRFEGEAEHVGAPDKGKVEISGRVAIPRSFGLVKQLRQATLSLTELLKDTTAANELSRHAGGARHLPITLKARADSDLSDVVYETPAGSRPAVKFEVSDPKRWSGVLDFLLTVDGNTVTAPASCGSHSSGALLETGFDLHFGAQLLRVEGTASWRCAGTAMKTSARD